MFFSKDVGPADVRAFRPLMVKRGFSGPGPLLTFLVEPQLSVFDLLRFLDDTVSSTSPMCSWSTLPSSSPPLISGAAFFFPTLKGCPLGFYSRRLMFLSPFSSAGPQRDVRSQKTPPVGLFPPGRVMRTLFSLETHPLHGEVEQKLASLLSSLVSSSECIDIRQEEGRVSKFQVLSFSNPLVVPQSPGKESPFPVASVLALAHLPPPSPCT